MWAVFELHGKMIVKFANHVSEYGCEFFNDEGSRYVMQWESIIALSPEKSEIKEEFPELFV